MAKNEAGASGIGVPKLEFGNKMLCPACLRFGDEQLGDAVGAEASAAWLATKLELRG